MGAVAAVALLGLGVAVDQSRPWRAETDRRPAPTPSAGTQPESPSVAPSRSPSLSPSASRGAIPPGPRIVSDHLRFGATRKAETAAYAARHYGERTARLRPTMIVLHYSESDTYASVRSLFEADQPSRGEAPGTCAHYVVEQDGTIHELVPPSLICRHTVGLNHVAIGIEFVQASHGHGPRWSSQQVLARPAQAAAGVALVETLQRRFAIPDQAVIGHAMANEAKEFRDLAGWRNDHLDWQAPEVAVFRARLTTP